MRNDAPRLRTRATRDSRSAEHKGLVVGRRLGAAYLGIAILQFFGRSAPPSDIRSVICVAMSVALTLLAIFGLMEFGAGRVGKGILPSVVLEVLLTIGFVLALVQ